MLFSATRFSRHRARPAPEAASRISTKETYCALADCRVGPSPHASDAAMMAVVVPPVVTFPMMAAKVIPVAPVILLPPAVAIAPMTIIALPPAVALVFAEFPARPRTVAPAVTFPIPALCLQPGCSAEQHAYQQCNAGHPSPQRLHRPSRAVRRFVMNGSLAVGTRMGGRSCAEICVSRSPWGGHATASEMNYIRNSIGLRTTGCCISSSSFFTWFRPYTQLSKVCESLANMGATLAYSKCSNWETM
jgi:hypothetical protein